MRKLYLHSTKASDLSFYTKEDVFLYTDNIFTEKVENEVLDMLSMNIVESVRMNFQEFKCIDLIGIYFDYFRENRILPELVMLACMNLVSLINRKLNEEYHDNNLLMENVPRAYLNENFYIDDLELAFTQNIFSILHKIKSKSPKSDAEIVREIKKYIDDRYYEDLSLDGVSEEFFISKYQLSRIFKKEIGINNWDYITAARMEKACLLITNSDLKVYEIAQKVGYDDISHFSTAFKKYVGKSPKEFKNLNIN